MLGLILTPVTVTMNQSTAALFHNSVTENAMAHALVVLMA